jgi:toxin FitB
VIVLDTNVISELTRRAPAAGVVSWLDTMAATDVSTTAVTAAELRYGVARLPRGQRRAQLETAVDGLLSDDFGGRILPFDEHAAQRYAEIVVARERAGRPIGTADAQIAAICRAVNGTLATRNTPDFEGTGVELINPWKLGLRGRAAEGFGSGRGVDNLANLRGKRSYGDDEP